VSTSCSPRPGWAARGADRDRRGHRASAPAHAASLRALLGAGFRPIGGEALFFG
jgi:hypothetical protein